MQQNDISSPNNSLSSTSTPNNERKPKSDQTRQLVEDQLYDLLQVLFELTVMVYDFQPDRNKLVWNKVNAVLEGYKSINELKDELNLFIPEEVISYVENGKNPDLFTQGFISRAATENQFTNGKIKAVDDFRSLLSEEFAKSFPDLYENNYNLDDSPPSTSDIKEEIKEESL
ncbi:transcription factor subunit Med10 of mediator complex-domain-containing protein [Cunninghamella echinulata]|nr:transcription factor subunit Med10 of mediator complex-domain-containing protein [Cunninghamella echinulata]